MIWNTTFFVESALSSAVSSGWLTNPPRSLNIQPVWILDVLLQTADGFQLAVLAAWHSTMFKGKTFLKRLLSFSFYKVIGILNIRRGEGCVRWILRSWHQNSPTQPWASVFDHCWYKISYNFTIMKEQCYIIDQCRWRWRVRETKEETENRGKLNVVQVMHSKNKIK